MIFFLQEEKGVYLKFTEGALRSSKFSATGQWVGQRTSHFLAPQQCDKQHFVLLALRESNEGRFVRELLFKAHFSAGTVIQLDYTDQA